MHIRIEAEGPLEVEANFDILCLNYGPGTLLLCNALFEMITNRLHMTKYFPSTIFIHRSICGKFTNRYFFDQQGSSKGTSKLY